MNLLISSLILLSALISSACADPIDRGLKTGAVLKMLREMVNQTQADTLNLPANATSIRENITDTFSCENRTYGYYADVDNDCQIFHVCLTSEGATGRNTTYRWSFICPQETVFNQEVLVCTRVRDSIPCEESPNYYDLNMEIGKISPDAEPEKAEASPPPNRNVERVTTNKKQKRPIKKQNIIVESVMKEAMEEMEVINDEIVESQDTNVEDFDKTNEDQENIVSLDKIVLGDKRTGINEVNSIPVPDVTPEQVLPVIVETSDIDNVEPYADSIENDEAMANTRLAAERTLKRRGRQSRGSIRFKSEN